MTYAQKLRDPRWQKKRLQILERDGWRCCACGDGTANLQVHHLYYAKQDPWDYPNESYQTLCDSCHAFRQQVIDSSVNRFKVSLAGIPNDSLGDVLDERLDGQSKRIKGSPLKIYLAGKIRHTNWRHKIVKHLRDSSLGLCSQGISTDEPVPKIIHDCIFDFHHYVGPFPVGCDHGCFHGRNTHGAYSGLHGDQARIDPNASEVIRQRALDGIRSCDLFFAYIDSEDCYGTLFEIGYANALKKKVSIARREEYPDLWFCLHPDSNVLDLVNDGVEMSPSNLLAMAIERHYPEFPFIYDGGDR